MCVCVGGGGRVCIGQRACMRMSGNAGMKAIIKYIYVAVCCLDCLVLLCPVVVVYLLFFVLFFVCLFVCLFVVVVLGG